MLLPSFHLPEAAQPEILTRVNYWILDMGLQNEMPNTDILAKLSGVLKTQPIEEFNQLNVN